jgi:hypothetical protein
MRHGGEEYSSYLFLTSALDGVSCQRHAPAEFYPRERNPGTHWIGGWVDLRAGLDAEAKEKSFAPVWGRTPVVQSVVRHCTDWATPAPFVVLEILRLCNMCNLTGHSTINWNACQISLQNQSVSTKVTMTTIMIQFIYVLDNSQTRSSTTMH